MPITDKEKKREADAKRYEEKKEARLEYQRKYYQEHKAELSIKQKERDKKRSTDEARRQRHNEQQRARYWARREELLARRNEQRRKQREEQRKNQAPVTKQKKHVKWIPVLGWEERYQAEELAKYGPLPEEAEDTRSPEELEELRERIFAALDGKAGSGT